MKFFKIILVLTFFIGLSLRSMNDEELAALTIPQIKARLELQGNPDHIHYIIGMKFYQARGVPKDVAVAVAQFTQAAKKGDLSALYPVSTLLIGENQDFNSLFTDVSWLKKMAKNDNLIARWIMQLGLWLPFPQLTKNQHDTLLSELNNFLKYATPFNELFNKLILKNDAHALAFNKYLEHMKATHPSQSYLFNVHAALGGAKNLHEAEKIAQDHPSLLYTLGLHYAQGWSVSPDEEKAHTLILKASQENYSPASVWLAQFNLKRGPEHYKEAFEYLNKAINQENVQAYYLLGITYLEGISSAGKSDPDFIKAFEFLKKAADKDFYRAMYYLARLYNLGLGTEKNVSKADELFTRILNNPKPDSLYLKGFMYELGDGVEKNLDEARKYYQLFLSEFDSSRIYVQKALARVEENISKQKEKIARQSLSKTEKAKNKKKTKKQLAKKMAGSSSAEPTSQENEIEEEEEERQEFLSEFNEIDITSLLAQSALNAQLSYDDQSSITQIDPQNNTITITNPYDDSTLTLTIDDQKLRKPIRRHSFKKLKKYLYDKRVEDWFGDTNKLLEQYPLETIERHRFAQRVDEIIQLYGSKAFFVKQDGTIEKNKILTGSIKTKDDRLLEGIFEYSYYKNNRSQTVLYHRFLHPKSKTALA